VNKSKDEKRKEFYRTIQAGFNVGGVVTDLNHKKRQDKYVREKAVEKIWQIVRKYDDSKL
jgi:hypothetical protein